MKTLTLPECPECGEHCFDDEAGEVGEAYCDLCGCEFRYAPWTYRELCTWIALEFLYTVSREAWARAGNGIQTRRDFIERPQACALAPLQIIRALQAGVEFTPILPGQPATKKSNLTLVR